MDAPLHVNFRREVGATLLVITGVLGLAVGGALIAGTSPAILLVAVPFLALLAAHGLRCARPALTVDSEGIAGLAGRLRWHEVEDVSVDPRSGLVASGAGRRLTAPLALLDTPVETILARVEREWGRPVESR